MIENIGTANRPFYEKTKAKPSTFFPFYGKTVQLVQSPSFAHFSTTYPVENVENRLLASKIKLKNGEKQKEFSTFLTANGVENFSPVFVFSTHLPLDKSMTPKGGVNSTIGRMAALSDVCFRSSASLFREDRDMVYTAQVVKMHKKRINHNQKIVKYANGFCFVFVV